jgi:hypothetical protein
MTEAELGEIQRRASASGPPDGLRVTHDQPTTLAVAAFVAHAYDDVQQLVTGLRESRRPPDAELDAIEARAEAAGPLPWRHFLESDPAMAGSSLIWIGGARDDMPDLYLWRGDHYAPDEDFVFIAHAREDIPRLVAEARALVA